jgi:hypothetical protein
MRDRIGAGHNGEDTLACGFLSARPLDSPDCILVNVLDALSGLQFARNQTSRSLREARDDRFGCFGELLDVVGWVIRQHCPFPMPRQSN